MKFIIRDIIPKSENDTVVTYLIDIDKNEKPNYSLFRNGKLVESYGDFGYD